MSHPVTCAMAQRPAPPACQPPRSREAKRLWRAVGRLAERAARLQYLGQTLSVWARATEEAQKRRRDAFFDAMGDQMRAAKRQCIGLEGRVSWHGPLRYAFGAWRNMMRIGHQQQAWADVVELSCRRFALDRLALAAWRVLIVWRREACGVGSTGTSDHCTSNQIARTILPFSTSPSKRADSRTRSFSAQSRTSSVDESDRGTRHASPQNSPVNRLNSASERPSEKKRRPEQLFQRPFSSQSQQGVSSVGSKRSSSVSGQMSSRRELTRNASSSSAASMAGRSRVAFGGSIQADPHTPSSVQTISLVDGTIQALSDASPACRESRPNGGEGKSKAGPERFFYDKGRYTGCARHGGPSIDDRVGTESPSGAGPRWQGGLRGGQRRSSVGLGLNGAGSVQAQANADMLRGAARPSNPFGFREEGMRGTPDSPRTSAH